MQSGSRRAVMARYTVSLLVLLLLGCGTVQRWGRGTDLEKSTHNYGIAIRWGQYEVAKAFIRDPEVRAETLSFEAFKKIKVTSYEVLRREMSEDQLFAEQIVEIEYYLEGYMKEKKIIDNQIWEYDQKEKRWYLKTGLPDFR
jgi:hypothetical protein